MDAPQNDLIKRHTSLNIICHLIRVANHLFPFVVIHQRLHRAYDRTSPMRRRGAVAARVCRRSTAPFNLSFPSPARMNNHYRLCCSNVTREWAPGKSFSSASVYATKRPYILRRRRSLQPSDLASPSPLPVMRSFSSIPGPAPPPPPPSPTRSIAVNVSTMSLKINGT